MSENTDINTDEIKKQLSIQMAVLRCAEILRVSDSTDHSLEQLLAVTTDFYCADRAHIFEFDDDMVYMHNTYEWCRRGAESCVKKLSEVEIRTVTHWLESYDDDGGYMVNCVDTDVPEDSEGFRLLKECGINRVMSVPLRSEGQTVGFISIDEPRENTDSFLMLQTVCAFAVNELHRRQTMEQRILKALSDIYISIYMRNIPENTVVESSSSRKLRRFMRSEDNAREQEIKAINELVDEEHLEAVLDFYDYSKLAQRMKNSRSTSIEFLTKTGRWCRSTHIVMNRNMENEPIQVINTLRYIDSEKRKELAYQRELKKALENQNEIYAEMLHMQGCGMIASEPDGRIITINDAALEILGMERRDDLYMTVFDRIISDDKDKIRETFFGELKEKGRFSAEYAIERPDGQTIFVMSEVRMAELKGGDRVMVNSIMDITEKKKLEQELLLLSETDSLTGISNRRSGEKKIERIIAEGGNGMFCLLDVDKFKQINDKFGHVTGDKALVETAECLKKSFRSSDVVMRLGGDEFAVFVNGVETRKQGEESIKRFFAALERVTIPEMCGGKVNVSLGAVFCTPEDRDYDKIYADADKAMYVCKSKKGNYYDFYSEK